MSKARNLARLIVDSGGAVDAGNQPIPADAGEGNAPIGADTPEPANTQE